MSKSIRWMSSQIRHARDLAKTNHIHIVHNEEKTFLVWSSNSKWMFKGPWVAWQRKIKFELEGKKFNLALTMQICWVFKPQTSIFSTKLNFFPWVQILIFCRLKAFLLCTMFFTSNVKNIYLEIWIWPIKIAKHFSHPMTKIIKSKQI